MHLPRRRELLPTFVRLLLRFRNLAFRFALCSICRAASRAFLLLFGWIAHQVHHVGGSRHDRSFYRHLPAVRKRNHVKHDFVSVKWRQISVHVSHGALHSGNRTDTLHITHPHPPPPHPPSL